MKLIGLTGISGSGKTYFSNQLKNALGAQSLSVLSCDHYYKDLKEQIKDPNGFVNFDVPEALKLDRLLQDIQTLKQGRPLSILSYEFNNPQAPPQKLVILPRPILLIEGLFVMHINALLKQLDLSIYLEVDAELTLKRRLTRDIKERGVPNEQVLYQWQNHVLPGFKKYIEPYKTQADLILDSSKTLSVKEMNEIKKKIISLRPI